MDGNIGGLGEDNVGDGGSLAALGPYGLKDVQGCGLGEGS